MARESRAGGGGWQPVLAACGLTGFGMAKPLVVDDTAYVVFARHLADRPLDPYGFELFWGNEPTPAMDVLLAPLLPYWLAGGVRLFGEEPLLWKLWLLPFALVLAFATRALARRLAPGLEAAVTWLVCFSPAALLGLNLMLDVPALALGVGALALFARAVERDSSGGALLAGAVAGLAAQTKYPALLSLAALGAWALAFGRVRLGGLAAVTAGCLFAAWEGFVASRYGSSHFLKHLADPLGQAPDLGALPWIVSLFALLGAAAPGAGLLALARDRVSPALRVGGFALVTGGLALLPLLPREPVARFSLLPALETAPPELWGLAALGVGVLALVFRAWRDLPGFALPAPRFLLLWLAIEAAGFFAAAPFPALRRVLALAAVLTFAAAHAVSRSPRAAGALRAAVVTGCAVGVLFASADIFDARARRGAVADAVARLRAEGADLSRQQGWFLGHWGFQYYAEAAGLKPLAAGQVLHAGDWLLVPDAVLVQRVAAPAGSLESVGSTVARSPWPWSTLPNAYGGAVAIRGQPERQLEVALYRVVRDTRAVERASAGTGTR